MAQTPSAPRITQPIDESVSVKLKGTVHPLARAANDRGAAPDSMPLDRIQVVLKRSGAQESALKQLIADLHTPGSASYHKWLTPDQFGRRFGPSDRDISTIEAWLQSKGFRIAKVNPGRQTLEMSGNVAQFRSAFHAQIHKYEVSGEIHYANATDPQIPAALAPVFGGFATLNNFRLKSYAKALGNAIYDPRTGKTAPEWTQGSAATGYTFALSPGDYAVQYDLNPLYMASTNGTGQTIAIVNESNINIYLVNQFRSLFSLPVNPPEVIIDGNDPGVDGINNPDGPNGASVEAYLDVEWSGAVAPNATIDLVIAADTALESGLFLALEHAIYGNIAPVISISFSKCEKSLGSTNQFINRLFEQAAAQGTTVIVSTGDNGSANCDNDDTQYYSVGGQAVSGFASTPYNIAVGGTDFYYSAWNQGSTALNAQLATYWNTTPSNNTPALSIKGVIPEQPWNASQYGLNINSVYVESGETQTSIAGGSGGASNCAIATYNSDGSTANCISGYPKPVWQTGAGVPADKVRDIPDLSLFASSGDNASFYVICATDGDCQPVSSNGSVQFFAVGGTSAAAPSFAGMMALINQRYGRQGQADYVLYPLATQFPAVFHDVTVGTISVPCNITTVTADSTDYPPLDCIAAASPLTVTDPFYGTATEGQIGTGNTPEYNATAGYDLATGIGTVDANVLVTDWNKVTFTAPTVTLASPIAGTYAHGSSVSMNATVSGSLPTGNVALLTDSSEPVPQGREVFALSNGTATGTITTLPGGTYNVWASYSGDSRNAGGQSPKTPITVNPEDSGVYLNVFTPNGNGGYSSLPAGTTGVTYGSQLLFSAQVAPGSKLAALEACQTSSAACPVFGIPTGIVTFADNGTAINAAVLNAEGDAEYNPSDPVAAHVATNIGAHSITASYTGDASYNASTAAATTYTVVQATPSVNLNWPNATIFAGQATTLTAIVESTGFGAPPTGNITVSGAPSGTPTSVPLSASGVDLDTGVTESYATFVIPSSASAGDYSVTLIYSGDANYTANSASGTIAISAHSALKPSTTTIITSSSATSPESQVSITVTVTGAGAVAPTGTVLLEDSAYAFNPLTITPVSGTDTSTVTIQEGSSSSLQGANILVAAYSGDAVYAPSSSTATNLANPLSDFSIVPETTIVPVTAGSSGQDTINLASVNGFAGSVSFRCAGTTVTCSVSSSANLSAGSTVPLTLTIDAGSSVASGNYDVLVTGKDATGEYVHTLAIEAVVTGSAPTPGFALSAVPIMLTLAAGATIGNTSTITVTPSNGFTGDVSLACSVTAPAGATSPATCGLSPATPDVTSATAVTSTLTVATTAATTLGTYTIKVTGTAGAINSPATVTVTVTAAPTFALNADPTTLNFNGGATTGNTSTITVTPSNGFTGNVALACAVTGPAGATSPATCGLNPAAPDVTGTAAVTSTLTVATSTTTTPGIYTVVVTGTSGAMVSMATVTVTIDKIATATALASAFNPSSFGQAVTFKATASASSAGTPTGFVTFKSGTDTLNVVPLSGTTAILAISTLAVGSDSITADYSGDSTFAASTSPALLQVVERSGSKTTLTSSANPSSFHQAVTFAAKVASSAGLPSGTVTFLESGKSIGRGSLIDGVATFTTSTLPVGTHSITAAYSGSADIVASTSSAIPEVTIASKSSTKVESSLNPSKYGQLITFTAAVKPATSGVVTGTVTFENGSAILGAETLSAGKATISIKSLAAGDHSMTAVYKGNTDYLAGASPAVTQVVDRAATTTTLTSSLNPAKQGAAVTFTAKVIAATGPTPTGTVAFKDGTTKIGEGTLSAAGKASFTTSTLSAKKHSITAVYSGNANDLTSTSLVLLEGIN